MAFEGYGETGLKVLTAAEKLFAEYGYHGVSLRQITAEAGVNLAAVNYHHSDKESLYGAILRYRLHQLNRARLTRLDTAEERASGRPVPITALVDILARPLLMPDFPTAHGAAGRRLLGRILVEPLPFTAPILATEFQPAMTRWGQAVRRHLPAMAPAEFLWQLSFVVGALHHAAASLHDMKARTSGICADDDAASALEKFCEFAAGSFAANGFRR
jgi:AcrR family transcriptional regulator